MSRIMEEYQEAEFRGYRSIEGKFACAACFSDQSIKQFILKRTKVHNCSYCGKTTRTLTAAPMNEIQDFIMDAIRAEFGDPQDEGGIWDSEDKHWIGTEVMDSSDLFLHEDVIPTKNDEILNDLQTALLDREWSPSLNSTQENGKSLVYSWKHFAYHLKHKARYVFYHKSSDPFGEDEYDTIPVAKMLTSLEFLIKSTSVIDTIPVNTNFFRVRVALASKSFTKASELGPPPIEECKYPNRMSPAGISMFYGAFDKVTAMAETVIRRQFKGKVATIATFRNLRKLKMLNLTSLPEIPSIYDESQREFRSSRIFLKEFTKEITLPVKRDGREHIEYVPTQVFAEYLRYIFRDAAGERLDGIIYASSKTPNGKACVLFLEQGDCCDSSWRDKTGKTLELHRATRDPKAKNN